MFSTIFDEKLAPDLEYSLRFLSLEFAKELKEVPDIFKGFYIQDEKARPVQERTNIRKMDALIWQIVEKLYTATNERISEKIFERQLRSLSLFSEDDVSPIRCSIGEDGVRILIAILRGARTRKQISTQEHIPQEIMRKEFSLILGLDLATEGLEIVLTNRGLKFLGLIGPDFDEQYKKYETNSFELIFNKELLTILAAVAVGAKTAEKISVYVGLSSEDVKKRLPIALSYDLIMGKAFAFGKQYEDKSSRKKWIKSPLLIAAGTTQVL